MKYKSDKRLLINDIVCKIEEIDLDMYGDGTIFKVVSMNQRIEDEK